MLSFGLEVLFCPPRQRVSEGALSPDGTVLATASHDGYIKFWQMYIEAGQDKPRWVALDRSLHGMYRRFQEENLELLWFLRCPGVFMS